MAITFDREEMLQIILHRDDWGLHLLGPGCRKPSFHGPLVRYCVLLTADVYNLDSLHTAPSVRYEV